MIGESGILVSVCPCCSDRQDGDDFVQPEKAVRVVRQPWDTSRRCDGRNEDTRLRVPFLSACEATAAGMALKAVSATLEPVLGVSHVRQGLDTQLIASIDA